jgi:peptidoglycan hydrolase-like protein with peptidoglycan-binding domain
MVKLMIKKDNYRISKKIHHRLSYTTIAALFSVILILSAGGIGLPLLQQQQQEAYASSQAQAPPQPSMPASPPSATQAQRSSIQALPTPPPTPICDPQSPTTLQLGSTGAKVAELQRVLTQVGYGSLLLGRSGGGAIDGKFTTSTQNAVKKFQQDNRIPVDGKVGPITWGALCEIIPNSFIVQLKSPAGSSPLSPLSPGSLREIIGSLRAQIAAAGSRIGAVYDQFGMFNVVFEGPQAKREQFINALRANPAVQAVFNDHIVTASQMPPQPPQKNSTGINRIGADLSAAKSGDGGGPPVDADIAILDTGVNRHPDLNVFRCVSFVFFLPVPLSVCNDGRGHGSMVAGIAAAKDNNIGVVGAAPGARIWSLKVLGDNGRGANSDVLEGLNYVAAHANEIEVANLSLGHVGFSFPYLVATTVLVARGVVVVVAAGNNNIDANSFTPASSPAVITVSAVTDSDGKCGGAGRAIRESRTHFFQPRSISNPDDFFASYSNYGSVIDLAAPGSGIYSTNNVTGYSTGSGTSFAAPYVSGAAALYKSLHPTANPFQVDAFLKNTGTKAPATGNPRICDTGTVSSGRGYFDDNYFPLHIIVFTDKVREPLLYMGGIK